MENSLMFMPIIKKRKEDVLVKIYGIVIKKGNVKVEKFNFK